MQALQIQQTGESPPDPVRTNSGSPQGRACVFCGLVANFCSLKTKKIPTRRVLLGYCLGHSRVNTGVGIFTSHG